MSFLTVVKQVWQIALIDASWRKAWEQLELLITELVKAKGDRCFGFDLAYTNSQIHAQSDPFVEAVSIF